MRPIEEKDKGQCGAIFFLDRDMRVRRMMGLGQEGGSSWGRTHSGSWGIKF